jgi:hypothetical protein
MFTDFVIKYNPKEDTPEDLTKRVLRSIVLRRLQYNKPAVLFISGDSGEGKSFGALKLQETLLELQGLELKDYINNINVYTPLQYPEKLQALLFNKELKKANIICMHEAREVIKAKNWHSFVNVAISDVNAMSRSVKRLCIMIISQFIRDISTDIRYTINYYIKVRRPMGGNKRARLYISVMWKDDRDLEKPKLRKRRLSGFVVYPDGRRRRWTPDYLEVTRPKKENTDIFEKSDREAKEKLLKSKMDKLIKEMRTEVEAEEDKTQKIADFYTKDQEQLNLACERYRGGWKIKKSYAEMSDLNKTEIKRLNELINKNTKDRGLTQENG